MVVNFDKSPFFLNELDATHFSKIYQSNLIWRAWVVTVASIWGFINDNLMAKINNPKIILYFRIICVFKKARVSKTDIFYFREGTLHLLISDIFILPKYLTINDNLFEIHLIFRQGTSFVCKNIFNLPQILINRSIVSTDKAFILLWIASSIFFEHAALEELYHFHSNNKWNGYKVSHQEPPRSHIDPKTSWPNNLNERWLTVLDENVKESHD